MLNKKIKKQSKSNLRNIIISIIGLFFCVCSIKQAWIFAIFFACSIAFHFAFYIKNKKREKALEEFLEPLESEEERAKRLKKSKDKDKEFLEQEHQDYLERLEEDFADDDVDDDEME